jgi:hypothetical protein
VCWDIRSQYPPMCPVPPDAETRCTWRPARPGPPNRGQAASRSLGCPCGRPLGTNPRAPPALAPCSPTSGLPYRRGGGGGYWGYWVVLGGIEGIGGCWGYPHYSQCLPNTRAQYRPRDSAQRSPAWAPEGPRPDWGGDNGGIGGYSGHSGYSGVLGGVGE